MSIRCISYTKSNIGYGFSLVQIMAILRGIIDFSV